tara:strand:+ start:340 stop:474 length:135 start_codon:yes stop_codon:yes gene_type:complete
MWVYYQNVTMGPFQFSEEAALFAGLTLLTAFFVILPSYIEKNKD